MGAWPYLHSEQGQMDYFLLPWHANYGSGNNQLHIHPVYHLLFVLEGSGILVRDDGEWPLQADDLLMINPNEKHVFHANEQTGWRFYALSFYLVAGKNLPVLGGSAVFQGQVDLPKLEQLTAKAKLETMFQIRIFQDQPIVHLTLDDRLRLLQLIQIYDQRFAALNPGFKKFWLDPQTTDKAAFARLATFFLVEWLDLLERIGRQDLAGSRPDPLLHRLYQHFDSLVFDKYDQRTLGQQLNYNPVYLAAYFRQKTGQTPRAYIDQRKIRQACIELHGSSCGIDELASRLHYSSAGHFCNNFKKLMQMTPRQYRSITLQ